MNSMNVKVTLLGVSNDGVSFEEELIELPVEKDSNGNLFIKNKKENISGKASQILEEFGEVAKKSKIVLPEYPVWQGDLFDQPEPF